MSVYIPEGYKSILNPRQTQMAIKKVKDFFERDLAIQLDLIRVSAPLFVTSSSGLNDDLNGVERAVKFDIKGVESDAEIVHSLAKWKRNALKEYGFGRDEGLYTDMNAIRRDEDTDNIHSVFVDQWDWERIISKEERTVETLKSTVKKIYAALRHTEKHVADDYAFAKRLLPEKITFVTSQELEDKYPDLTAKEREYKAAKEHGAIFLMQIGGALNRVFGLVYGYFQSADKPFSGVVVGGVVKRFEGGKSPDQFFVRLFLQFCSKLLVCRHFRERVATCRCLDVKSAAPAQDRYAAPFAYVLICLLEIPLILEYIVFLSGIGYIHQMVWDILIFAQILPGADVHSAIHLARVGGYDFGMCSCVRQSGEGCRSDVRFSHPTTSLRTARLKSPLGYLLIARDPVFRVAGGTVLAGYPLHSVFQQRVDPAGQLYGIACLPRGGGPQDAYQVDFSGKVLVQHFLHVYCFRRGHLGHRRYGSERFL